MLSENHYRVEWFKERMPAKQWQQILLNGDDRIFCNGRLRQLAAKSLGHGVVEVSKEALPDELVPKNTGEQA